MTDRPPPMPPARDEPRDLQVAAALEVAPLDETTRRRLVRAAADAAEDAAGGAPSRSIGRMSAALGVAAALVVGAVVGAVVVTSPDEPDAPVAARASSTEATTAPADAAAPAPQAGGDEAAPTTVGAPPQELGELGDVTGDPSLRVALDDAFESSGTKRSAATSGEPVPCADADPSLLGLVLVTAVGTASVDGTPVVVLVGPTPDGANVAVVEDPGRGCEILRRVTLPG